jgi:Cys-rich protein (TIGR01571 family)
MSTPAKITQASAFQEDNYRLQSSQSIPPPILPSSASNTRFVEVIAPSTLEEGYMFDAFHDGHVFPVTVPIGGVKAGESFTVPFVPNTDNADDDIFYAEAIPIASEVTPMLPSQRQSTSHYALTSSTAPLGRWKDGLCDCCAPGCCHPSLCNAICFKQILMGQVLTRMQRTWCGDPVTTRSQYKRTFPTLLWLTVAYWMVWIFFHCDHDHGGNCHGWRHGILGTVRLVWFLYTVIVMIKLRKAVRERYQIPQTHCQGCEDCCCVVFCSCCTMAQMARQTADYERQRAYCCTDTGLAEEKYTLQEALVV